MRRSDREITDRNGIDDIIRRCRVCRLGLCHDGQPYIVPMMFGYDGRFLYFHTAVAGKKLDILQKDSRVCFEFDILHEVIEADEACKWSIRYESVMGSGPAEFLDDPEAKRQALEYIMLQYGPHHWSFAEHALDKVKVFRVRIESISGKAKL
jgi:uncharacterized protein